MLAMGIAAPALGLGLIFYGRWFLRKITTQEENERRRRQAIRKLPMALVAVVLGHVVQSDLWACSSCYGEAAGPMIDGARMGVLVMFGFVLLMQFSFATFFICLWRRGRRSGEPETND